MTDFFITIHNIKLKHVFWNPIHEISCREPRQHSQSIGFFVYGWTRANLNRTINDKWFKRDILKHGSTLLKDLSRDSARFHTSLVLYCVLFCCVMSVYLFVFFVRALSSREGEEILLLFIVTFLAFFFYCVSLSLSSFVFFVSKDSRLLFPSHVLPRRFHPSLLLSLTYVLIYKHI